MHDDDEETLWRERLHDYLQSGKIQRQFCRDRGISGVALLKWARRLDIELPRTRSPHARPLAPANLHPLPPPTDFEEALRTRNFRHFLPSDTRRAWAGGEWGRLLADARRMGLSLEAYGRLIGIPPATLYSWRKRLLKSGDLPDETPFVASEPEIQAAGFASVVIQTEPQTERNSADAIDLTCVTSDTDANIASLPRNVAITGNFGPALVEVVLRNGRTLRLHTRTNFFLIEKLATIMERAE
ncbi:hypothetical protein AA23498_2001 [Acetobacter nitrogenifigens DSM 23921 = NBRC 105050]|uniref:Uncharacterized protein n=1 Tax=Acetobacter nitrogenifigens DSM 23921 = NBRC 105050 TaxID=1120919 RepID=A0A511XEU7_9PROT|nr:hypothetical protein [Acetobacter nitrogenifigens]GBQ94353.1 hypothetical protein AA23498_2001 [Acetobacter nitrogenifigens DSM 23921 = NBRC 105050]GEN61425.1 hypothetical protein ANI02nite_33090 [Acetobacter nitrogenifigens DSM 23921 = NBRC 105050]